MFQVAEGHIYGKETIGQAAAHFLFGDVGDPAAEGCDNAVVNAGGEAHQMREAVRIDFRSEQIALALDNKHEVHAVPGLITWHSCTDHVADHTLLT